MGEALLFGLIASSGLVAGPLIGLRWRVPRPVVATLLAFASGALISALAFELFNESFERAGIAVAGLGLLGGAGAFVALKEFIKSRAKRSGSRRTGLELLAGVTLDGIPENMALGVTLAGAATGSVSLLVAIFLSNFPESLVSTETLRQSGYSRKAILLTWTATALLLTVSVVVGDFVLEGAGEGAQAVCLAVAAGAVLAALADTLMPEAYREGGAAVAFATSAGFLLSFMLNQVG